MKRKLFMLLTLFLTGIRILTAQTQGKDMKMLEEEGNTYRTSWTFSSTLNYLKQYNKIHNLNVLLGQEAQKATDESAYMSNSNLPGEILYF